MSLLRRGDLLADRFEIDDLAGAGGMGTVFRARDRLSGAPVAIKVLQRWTTVDEERFAREAAVLAQLSHPGIVRYVGHGAIPPHGHYLAMEWVAGETLEHRLLRGRLDVAEAWRLGCELADAVAAAHRLGVVHRDLKPSNLLLTDGAAPAAKVLDFGIARRITHGAGGATATGVVVGTPGYMAPEQARGRRDLDARADVFALGCVLYEALTGQPAFFGSDVMAVLAKILLEETPRVSALRPEVPEALDLLVLRMMSKEPERRPADGAAVAEELARLSREVASVAVVGGDEGTPAPGDLAWLHRPRRGSLARIDAISRDEQRILCVVLVGNVRGMPAPIAVADTVEVRGPTREQLFRSMGEPYGARLEVLADGSTVVMLTGNGTAADLAARAARYVLTLRAIAADPPIALVVRRGVMGSRLPIGEVIDHAAEVLRAAKPGSVRINDVCASLLEARFELHRDGSAACLRGERPVVGAPRTVLGRATTCVGRDRELAVLDGIFAECVGEPVARAVVLTAPAGAGKSRLAYEFLDRARRRGVDFEVLVGQGDPLASGAAFGLLAEALRRAASIREGEPLEVRRQKLATRLRRHLAPPDAMRACEFLGELVGTPVGDASDALKAARQDARLMGDAMRAAWQDFIDAECAARPVVLLLEDLHWGDLPTVQLVAAALRSARERPLLVLAMARPEVAAQFPSLWSQHDPQEIRLGPLTRRASERLVREVLGDAPGASLVSAIASRADGNPFYLEELMRAVAATPAGAAGAGEALPESILAMVQARLDVLGAAAKRVLRAASIFGQTFCAGGVRALLGERARGTTDAGWLSELVEREVIFSRGPASIPGEVEYGFRHALLRDAAYSMLTDEDRQLGHRLAGQWLQRVGESSPLVIAEHLDRGRERGEAMGYYRRAAQQALDGNDFAAAIACVERALRCGATGETLGALHQLRAQAHFWRGQYAEAEQHAAVALAHAPQGTPLWLQAAGEMIAALGQQAKYDGVERWVAPVAGARVFGSLERQKVSCLSRAAGYLMDGGRVAAATELIARLGETPGGRAELLPRHAAEIAHAEAKRAVHEGDLGAAVAGFEAALRGFEAASDARAACESRVQLGCALAALGDTDGATAALEVAVAAAERMALAHVGATAQAGLATVFTARDELEPARESASRAAAFFRAHGDLRLAAHAHVALSGIALREGRLDEAEAEAREAIALAHGAAPAPRAPAVAPPAPASAGGRAAGGAAIAPAIAASARGVAMSAAPVAVSAPSVVASAPPVAGSAASVAVSAASVAVSAASDAVSSSSVAAWASSVAGSASSDAVSAASDVVSSSSVAAWASSDAGSASSVAGSASSVAGSASSVAVSAPSVAVSAPSVADCAMSGAESAPPGGAPARSGAGSVSPGAVSAPPRAGAAANVATSAPLAPSALPASRSSVETSPSPAAASPPPPGASSAHLAASVRSVAAPPAPRSPLPVAASAPSAAAPPVASPPSPVEASAPPLTTPAGVFSASPVAASAPPFAASAPPIAASAPSLAASAPPFAASAPPASASAPSLAASAPPFAASASPASASAPSLAAAAPAVAAALRVSTTPMGCAAAPAGQARAHPDARGSECPVEPALVVATSYAAASGGAGGAAALARVQLARGLAAAAVATAGDAVAGIETAVLDGIGGGDPHEPMLRLVLAEALAEIGDDAAALDALRGACVRLLDRAARIVDEAWRASFLERVPEHERTIALGRLWGVVVDAEEEVHTTSAA